MVGRRWGILDGRAVRAKAFTAASTLLETWAAVGSTAMEAWRRLTSFLRPAAAEKISCENGTID